MPFYPCLLWVIGVLLMIFKIAVDSEPGAIPLLLIVVGVGWYTLKLFRRGRRAKLHFFNQAL
jgi:hypothetical protein